MKTRQETDRFLEKWRRQVDAQNDFFFDGIVSERDFEGLLVILSEPHIRNNCRDLRTMAVGIAPGVDNLKFFRAIAMYGVAVLDENPQYECLEGNDGNAVEAMRRALKRIAIVNIKKVGGDANANEREVLDWLNAHRTNFLKQLNDHIQPRVILPCGSIARHAMESFFAPVTTSDAIGQLYSCRRVQSRVRHPSYWRRANRDNLHMEIWR